MNLNYLSLLPNLPVGLSELLSACPAAGSIVQDVQIILHNCILIASHIHFRPAIDKQKQESLVHSQESLEKPGV